MRYRPIRRNSEFGRVYARGKSYVNPALVMYVLKTRGKKTRVFLRSSISTSSRFQPSYLVSASNVVFTSAGSAS